MDAYLMALAKYLGLTSIVVTYKNNTKRTYLTISQIIVKETFKVYLIFVLPFFVILCFVRLNDVISNLGLNVLLNCMALILAFCGTLLKQKIALSKHSFKPINLDLYKREIPSKLRPLHVRMLIKDGIIDEFSISCTILDLVDRGYLTLESKNSANNIEDNIFSIKEVTTIYLTDKPQDDLFMYESYLINWFIKELGDGQKVTNKELNEKLNLTGIVSSKNFEYFQALALASFPINRYYEANQTTIDRFINFFLTMISPLGIANGLNFITIFLYTFGIGNILWGCPKRYLNQAGIEERDRWLDLKKYLVDFSDMKNKNIDLHAIWNYYLTYSIALDLPSVAREQITDFFGENIFSNRMEISYDNYGNAMSEIKQWIMQEEEKYKKILD